MNPKSSGPKTLINFSAVSKRYKLGLTRTSLPQVLSGWFRNAISKATDSERRSEIWALRDVSFELARGESLALVGRNGAGKTTILKLLAGITQASSGTIEKKGRLAALIELGAGFHPDLTGRENVYLNGAILGLKKAEIDVFFGSIVEFSGLADFLDTPLKRYSSGMVVRLGFSVAACLEPDILLVDEVLAVGDAVFRQKCIQRIQELIRSGTSIVFVSHNLYMVQAVCRKALYLKDGQVQARGETKQVIRAYEEDLHTERALKFQQDRRNESPQSPKHIEFIKVAVLNSAGEEGAIESSERGLIKVHYEAYTDLGAVNLAVFLIRSDGLTCCMARTKIDGFHVEMNSGTGVVTVEFNPLQLVTGTYFAEVEFTDANDSFVLEPTPGRSDWFLAKGRTRSYDDRSGVFEPQVVWHHERVSKQSDPG